MYAIVAPLCTCRPVVYNVVLNVEDLFGFPYQHLGNKSSMNECKEIIQLMSIKLLVKIRKESIIMN